MPDTMMSDTLMSLAATARTLHLTRRTVFALLADGTLAGFRVGKTIRVSGASVQRLLASGAGLIGTPPDGGRERGRP